MSLSIALFGLGNMASYVHFPIIRTFSEFSSFFAYDPSERSRLLFKERFPEVEVFDSMEKLFAVNTVNVAVVITPPHHTLSVLEYVSGRITHGIFCEKPLGISSSEAEKITRLFPKPLISFCGFNRRFIPYFRELTKLHNKLQPLQLLEVSFHKHINDREHWRLSSTPLLITEGCHAIDIACELLNKPVVRSVIPLNTVDNDLPGVICHGTSEGSVPWAFSFNFGSGNQMFSVTCHYKGARVQLFGADTLCVAVENKPEQKFVIEKPEFFYVEGYYSEWSEFVAALPNNEPSKSSFDRALQTMRLCQSIVDLTD